MRCEKSVLNGIDMLIKFHGQQPKKNEWHNILHRQSSKVYRTKTKCKQTKTKKWDTGTMRYYNNITISIVLNIGNRYCRHLKKNLN